MTGWDLVAALELGFAAGFVTCALCWRAMVRYHRDRQRDAWKDLVKRWQIRPLEEVRKEFGLPPPMSDEELVGKTPKELEWLLRDGRITVNQARRAMGIWPEELHG